MLREHGSHKLLLIIMNMNVLWITVHILWYRKAFDFVNHNIPLLKMEFYVIIGKEKTLDTQYLTDRYQRVLLNNTKSHNFITSKWSKIQHCVP